MEILVMVGQLILGLSIIVGLHELGHLLTAKMFGMRVEKYFIGFPPKIWGFTKGETEYAIGAIPLGGFVKISGMIDESLDSNQMSAEPQPWEFRSKPAWQRLIVMLGGIIVNLILGIVIFILIAYNNGELYLSKQEMNKNGVVTGDLAREIGLRDGDKIVKVNNKDFRGFEQVVSSDVLLGTNSSYTVNRQGQSVQIAVPNNLIDKISEPNARDLFLLPAMPFVVGETIKNMPAEAAGLRVGDHISALNDSPIKFYNQIQNGLDTLKGQNISLTIERNGQPKELRMKVSQEGIGFRPKSLLKYDTISYSLAQAIPVGTHEAFTLLYNNIRGFGKIFRGEVSPSKSLSGPIGIAQMFGGVWDWGRFWFLTGFLSLVLAFMNALPIPALDGGHAIILLYEMISGRKPSDKFLEITQKVGMAIILALMVFAIFNDIWKAAN